MKVLMNALYRRRLCCLTLVLTLLVATSAFCQIKTSGFRKGKKTKPPAFALVNPTSVVQPGDTLTLTAAKGFSVKRGASPYRFFIGSIRITPTFTGQKTARLSVPVLSYGTYPLRIRYKPSSRKPLIVVFSRKIVVGDLMTPVEPIVQPEVTVLPEGTINGQTDSTLTLKGSFPGIAPGEVLVSSEGDGMIRKVLSVTRNSKTTTLTTEQATLPDVV
jgi:hypothetical protein